MVTCFLRYTLVPGKVAEFERYARSWIRLVERYGGLHHGYFVPADTPTNLEFSFAERAEAGPADIAIALFTFPSLAAYESYRRDVATDQECIDSTAAFTRSPSFEKYERTFLRPVDRDP
jgi:NIPSNAP